MTFFVAMAFNFLPHNQYFCRLSWFEKDLCIYQCMNGYERFTWVHSDKVGCPLHKKLYKV